MFEWHEFGAGKITSIEQMPKGAVGFIYKVKCLSTLESYIGKKALYHKKTLPPLKGHKRNRKTVKESNWLNYFGSNDRIKELRKDDSLEWERVILEYAFSKKQLTYLECKYQFKLDVLEDSTFLNDNILGKFFKNDLIVKSTE